VEDKIVAVPGSVLARGLQRWRSMLHWVRDVPVADPVDRRNAPMLQLVSFLLAVLPTAAWCYRALLVDIPWRPGEVTGMVFGLSVSAISALSLVLVRKGKFRAASHALLAVFAATVIPAYLVAGFGGQRFEQPVLAIWMAIAALAVGRMALWLMFLCIAAAFGLGIAVDIDKQGQAVELLGDAAFSTAIFLMIAVVLDRSSVALRESLREARARGDALDVANRRLTEEMAERERTFAQLVQAQKMEAVGRLASGVAHDFGNVLAVAGGYVRSGLRAGDAAHMRESLVGVDSAVNRANLLTRRLLSLARAEDGVEEWFDPGEALKALVPMIRQLMGPDVKVDVVLGADLPALFFDRMQFDLMVLNVAANADHAMPGGGRFLLRARRDGDRLVLDLADTGAGMAGDVLAHAFEPFFTTKPRGQGSGLGLSVVRDLVQRAGGSVNAESQAGVGTTISLCFADALAELAEAEAESGR
jgi:signal transduction histidine kinase